MKTFINKLFCILFCMLMSLSLFGCSEKQETAIKNDLVQDSIDEESKEEVITDDSQSTDDIDIIEEIEDEIDPQPIEEDKDDLDPIQKNSVNMLNYLAALTQEIRTAKNNRLFLEQAYSLLVNNYNPEKIDSTTLGEINQLLDTIEGFRMLSVKRERLEYLYEREKADAIKSAVPSPVAILSIVQSKNLIQAVTSVLYTAVDSIAKYETASGAADLNNLKNNWELDDKESETLHENTKSTFSYMVKMVNNYSIPGNYTLNENQIKELVNWKNNSNEKTDRQILEFLLNNKQTYEHYGDYWLLLAKTYYNLDDYTECLNAVNKYFESGVKIFRKDYSLSATLPYAIFSADQVLNGDERIKTVAYYADLIKNNSENQDWSLRYYAAKTYVDLYTETQDKEYLEFAYAITKANINECLLDKQYELNESFINEIKEEVVPKDATKEKKKEIKDYNNYLKELREKELPPVYEPLKINLDLLVSIAETLDISNSEKSIIDEIIHPNGKNIFISTSLDDAYWFGNHESTGVDSVEVVFEGNSIQLPLTALSDDSTINVSVNGRKINDWELQKINRKKKTIGQVAVEYTSKESKKDFYNDGDVVTITIDYDESLSLNFNYQVTKTKTFIGTTKTNFERIY